LVEPKHVVDHTHTALLGDCRRGQRRPPAGRATPLGGPGPHFHRTYDETFVVLSGTVRLYGGRTWFNAHPNVMLPEG
jgi:mannose-6-phosphate isomerase-like protein (cupin superfamily)